MKSYFIDSNIIMYSVGGEHPYKKPCQKIIELIRDEKMSCVTNTEIIQEILYRYISLKRKAEALLVARSMMEICEYVYSVNADDMVLAMELIDKNRTPNVRDSIHVSSMIRHKVHDIISTDRHFDHFSGIQRIDPVTFKINS